MSTSCTRFGGIGALLLAAGMTVSGAASADEWKATGWFGWFGVGKAMEVEKGLYYWTGEFSGSFQNDKGPGSLFHMAGVRCPAWNDLNFNTGKGSSGGYCVVRDASGDTVTMSWSIPPAPIGKGPGTFTILSGTGKYQGAKGTYPFVGVTEVNWADGMVTGYATWNR
jgi:hypothetical protein